MGIVRGLKNINQRVEQENAPREGGPKVNWLKLKDGETVRLRFLQELDEESPGYNEKAGVGFLAVEHQAGQNFKRRGVCSYDDEGRCFGCEQHAKDFKAGWRPKSRLYINVLVLRDGADPEVSVLAQGNGPKSVTTWLLEYAGDVGSITDRTFKMKRTGSGQTDTSYTLTPGKEDDVQYDVTQHELFDLDNVVREVPYDDQEKFYLGGEQQQQAAPSGDSGSDVEW
jgi:hypothetical protein